DDRLDFERGRRRTQQVRSARESAVRHRYLRLQRHHRQGLRALRLPPKLLRRDRGQRYRSGIGQSLRQEPQGRVHDAGANFVSQCFNGLVLGALLALISSGLTIIYGTLGVLNLAHGAMFMLGGYAGWLTYNYAGSFIAAVFGGALFVMIVGVI